jgi:hypothetical protein
VTQAVRKGDDDVALSDVPSGPPAHIYRENTTNSIIFNVMPCRIVEETLYLKEYRVWPRYAEATFDRRYESQMRNSPNHLIFLTLLAHTQKLLYVCLSEELGFEYSQTSAERFKIWPTVVRISMPALVRQSEGIVQRLWITDVTKQADRQSLVRGRSSVETIDIGFECSVFLLRPE